MIIRDSGLFFGPPCKINTSRKSRHTAFTDSVNFGRYNLQNRLL